ncbi:hypothetical protein [Neobacillus sp. LXY-1]|uniref:hypothetical protein n=1 Tax=Neobacillus sp. LXY-1 TaxID=3379133 RepID=UPI003EDFEACC
MKRFCKWLMKNYKSKDTSTFLAVNITMFFGTVFNYPFIGQHLYLLIPFLFIAF